MLLTTSLSDFAHFSSFFSIQIDGEPAGDIIFKLYDDVVPKTARNFRELATGQNPGKS